MPPVPHPKMIWSRVALTAGALFRSCARGRASKTLIRSIAFAALLGSGVSSTRAQDVAVDSFLPSPDQSGFVGFASTRTPGPWGADGTLWLDYGLGTYGRRGPDPVRHRFDGTVTAQLGILSRGALAVRMPVVFVQRGESGGASGPEVAAAPIFTIPSPAAGNPALDGRIRLLGAPVRPDGSVKDGAALALRGVVHIPVGTSHAHFADDSWRTELAATADIELFGIGAGVALGYRHRFDDKAKNDDALTHVLRLSAGLRLPLPLIARALPGRVQEAALLELDVGTAARDFFAKAKTPVEGRIGYRIIVGDLFGTLTFGAGFTDGIGAADFRSVLGVGYSPRQHDQDADGVPDSDDQCVHLPEDRDGFEDADGCADDDNDGDLIVDEDDQCPLAPAEPDRDNDEDGCTDP